VGLARNVAPEAGTIGRMQRLPHGYTHDTRSDGTMVVKRYQGPYADGRRSTERMLLSRLAGSVVPVPHLIDAPAGALRMRHVAGVHGQDLIITGLAGPVLRSCGRTLRQLQKVEPATVLGGMPGGARAVLVHGDYGPNNMLFDPITHTTAAVIDWEWAHAGDPVEDLAWCEWITACTILKPSTISQSCSTHTASTPTGPSDRTPCWQNATRCSNYSGQRMPQQVHSDGNGTSRLPGNGMTWPDP
jgi:hypothetical protein